MNNILISLITHFEGLHDGDLHQIGLQPKMDPVGIWTEGWGRAMVEKDGKFIKGEKNKDLAYASQTIHTIEEANEALLIDLKPFQLQVERKIKVKLTEEQTAAVISHFYNTGGSSTLCNLINSNDPKLYDWWCSHYISAQGVELKGLKLRRKTEANLFTTGVLKFLN